MNDNTELNMPSIPAGVTPLVWAETPDDHQNSHFEALSHLYADAEGTLNRYWRVHPVLEKNQIAWVVTASSAELLWDGAGQIRYTSAEAAKDVCERIEVEQGGAENAPRTPVENPDQSAPLTVDEFGFAPTRTIRARWSRNGGKLYLARVWAKPENPEFTKEVDIQGTEYDEALPLFLRQKMITDLVGMIASPEGWIVPLTIDGPAVGTMRMDCEVLFAEVRALWFESPDLYAQRTKAKVPPDPYKQGWKELEAPSHSSICSLVGEQLARRKAELDKQLEGKSVEDLQRQITKNAKAMGIKAEDPTPTESDTGHVIPITLENMQAEGVDLRGDNLRGDQR